MLSEKLHQKIRSWVSFLKRYTDRVWYPPLIGFLAAADALVVIIPSDGILISSSMLIPRRWLVFAASVALGSTLGSLLLAVLVEHQGLPWILELFPGVSESRAWSMSIQFFDKYGLLMVFVVALTPLMQQPAVIFASLAETPMLKLAAVMFAGRLIKFTLIAYLGSHAPRVLGKLWGLKGELDDAGVRIN